VRVVERILAGEPFFASAGAERQFVEAPECVPVQFLLTSRELQVLQMLMAGKSNKELAALLEMSVRTAESHHPNIMEKFRVESPGDLVRLRCGITWVDAWRTVSSAALYKNTGDKIAGAPGLCHHI
jgi:DNA-binding CsgD family transcriptional regulator